MLAERRCESHSIGDNKEWYSVHDIHVIGAAQVSSSSLPTLRKSKSAAILNVSSDVGMADFPQRTIYFASKGELHALTFAMVADYVEDGIQVNCVAPGTADSRWVGRLLESAADPTAPE
jgi:2-keto-3-deoxy-L-fuconate dehydrogenase